jgi:hypothetical protein
MTHGNFYYIDCGKWDFIFQFLGPKVKADNLNVRGKCFNKGTGEFSTSSPHNKLREATQEEILWFLECQRLGKYLPMSKVSFDNYSIF